MSMINCIIGDDEALAREIIGNHIHKIGKLNLIASCSNGLEVYAALKQRPVDLLFLDIQMPHLTGFELLRTVKNAPPVIITSAYREFALDGYEFNVLDFLLKPISFERFLKAIEKYENLFNPINEAGKRQLQEDRNDAFIYVRSDKKNIRLLLKDIVYIEGLKDYVKIHTKDQSIITHQTLTYLEGKLSADHFVRSHRSFIISLRHVNSFTATEIKIGETCLPIGYVYSKQVAQRFNDK